MIMDDNLLSLGIKDLLAANDTLQVSQLEPGSHNLLRAIKRRKPHVVVFDMTVPGRYSARTMASLLVSEDVQEVIVISVHSSYIQVYKKEKIVLTQKEAFTQLF